MIEHDLLKTSNASAEPEAPLAAPARFNETMVAAARPVQPLTKYRTSIWRHRFGDLTRWLTHGEPLVALITIACTTMLALAALALPRGPAMDASPTVSEQAAQETAQTKSPAPQLSPEAPEVAQPVISTPKVHRVQASSRPRIRIFQTSTSPSGARKVDTIVYRH